MSQASMLCSDELPTQPDEPGALGMTIPTTPEVAPEVAMLAATALGFAVGSGPTDGNVRRLMTLAESDPDVLVQAGAAVLQLCVASEQDRTIAVDLLRRAARCCSQRGLSLVGDAEHAAGSAPRRHG